MKKRIGLLCAIGLFALAALIGGCGGQKQESKGGEVLKVACNADFAPFEFQDASGKEYVGFDMDLIRAIGKEMGVEVQIQNINFDGLIPALDAGNIDVVITGMTITPERAQKVGFSKPYYQSGLTIAVKNDNQEIHGFKDLEGRTIAVQIGTTGANEAKKIKGAKVKEFNSSADTFLELKAGGVEAVINDRPVNDYYIAQGGSKDAKTLEEILTAEEYGIAVNKNNAELLKKIDGALDKVKASGEYDKIYEKWFGKKSS